jgi:hypothetical protein
MKVSARSILALIAAMALAGAAHAEDMSSCAAFKWPLDKERSAFDAAGLQQVASGAARGAWKEQAFALKLMPVADVAFTIPPGGRSKAGGATFGGTLTFEAPDKPGLYQVTLSGEGWVDVVQSGASLKSAGHSGAKNCPGLRKSVRFKLAAAPVVLQLSGVPAETIKVAISPVP